MNNTTLIGRLVRDPELRYLPNGGTAVCDFTIAVDKGLTREQRETFKTQGKPTADFIKVVVWGKQGESSAKFLEKGLQVAVQGRIQTGSYKQKDDDGKETGVNISTFEVVAEKVEFIDWADKKEDTGSEGSVEDTSTQQEKSETSSNEGFSGDGFSPVDDEEIPF